ncbi:probable prolyl 4-hydroxylase 3 isoform X2 [Cucurbita maxima]|uniref:Probable prolyl 4-hydroxylase 3 isoform X2 n=1 Tax=Cucurbita maxima TaxID=3661 RepID=A0A6J1HMY2_CUCMA|nr:probable prolyl 4-hydroxylase 3 isoform X2 [Cucurbita maxima]
MAKPRPNPVLYINLCFNFRSSSLSESGFDSSEASSFFNGVLKGKYMKSQGRKWSTFKLSKIVMAFLLALGISMFIAFRFFSPTESSHSNLLHRLASVQHRAVHSDGLGKREDQWVEFISWEPRAFVYHNFLSKEECLYLISLAKPYMKKSTVVDVKTGKIKDSRTRTSSGMFLNREQNKIVSNIEKRIADFTFIPVEHGEALTRKGTLNLEVFFFY